MHIGGSFSRLGWSHYRWSVTLLRTSIPKMTDISWIWSMYRVKQFGVNPLLSLKKSIFCPIFEDTGLDSTVVPLLFVVFVDFVPLCLRVREDLPF